MELHMLTNDATPAQASKDLRVLSNDALLRFCVEQKELSVLEVELYHRLEQLLEGLDQDEEPPYWAIDLVKDEPTLPGFLQEAINGNDS